jgi:formylglycine-generating enzyme required for sulfatase activity
VNFDADAHKDEGPVREVAVQNFQIGRYAVTVAEYASFVTGEGYHEERWWSRGGFGTVNEPQDWNEQLSHPRDWRDALALYACAGSASSAA